MKDIQSEIAEKELQLNILYLIHTTDLLKTFLKENNLKSILINVEEDHLSGEVFHEFSLTHLNYCSGNDEELDDFPEIADLKIAEILASKGIESIKFTKKSNLFEIVYPDIALKLDLEPYSSYHLILTMT